MRVCWLAGRRRVTISIVERIAAERVIVARGVREDARAAARLEAMLANVDAERVDWLDDADFERALATLGPREGRPRAGLEGRGRPKAVVAFGTFSGDELSPVFPGYSWREKRDGRRQRDEHGALCHTAIEVQSVVGCPFDCAYCPYTSFVCVRLDVERFVDRVTRLVRARPNQTLWKLNNRSDTLGLEPEYGLSRALVLRFAELGGPTLMLYSKGDEVAHLEGLEHRGRTVASFTVTPDRVASLLEQGAPEPGRRIAALGALHRAGYPTRVRFSPIVPLAGWRDDYDALVRRVAAAGAPELVTLWTLSMIDAAELPHVVPASTLDRDMLARAEAARDTMRDAKGAPFPPDARAEIYASIIASVRRHLPQTRVSLCLEAPEVWDRLGDDLPPRRRGAFLCNCGPRATPEAVRLVQLRPRARSA